MPLFNILPEDVTGSDPYNLFGGNISGTGMSRLDQILSELAAQQKAEEDKQQELIAQKAKERKFNIIGQALSNFGARLAHQPTQNAGVTAGPSATDYQMLLSQGRIKNIGAARNELYGKLADIAKVREGSQMPNEVKQYLFSQQNPDFTKWLDRNLVEPSSGMALDKLPDKARLWQFRSTMNPQDQAAFDAFLNPDKTTPGSVEKDVSYYQSLPEGPLKDWVQKVIQFRTTGGMGVALEAMEPGTVGNLFGSGKGAGIPINPVAFKPR